MHSGPRNSLLSPEEILATAEMARLALDPTERARLAGELSQILGYAELLQEVDVKGVPPTTHAVPLGCPLRGDVTGPHDSTEAALRNAPARESAFFAVPAIFGDRGGDRAHRDEAADDRGEG